MKRKDSIFLGDQTGFTLYFTPMGGGNLLSTLGEIIA